MLQEGTVALLPLPPPSLSLSLFRQIQFKTNTQSPTTNIHIN